MYIYLIAIGPKGVSHEEVESKFMEYLKKISNPFKKEKFYYGLSRQMENLHGELLFSLQDQLKHRSANCIILGNGKYTSRFGMTVDVCDVASGFAACKLCFSKLLSKVFLDKSCIENSSLCKKCIAWSMECSNGKLDFPPPEHYPVELLPKNGKLCPIKLCYKRIKAAVTMARTRIKFCHWTTQNENAYLHVHGLNKDATRCTIENSINVQTYRLACVYKKKNSFAYEMVEREKKLHPCSFQLWKFPFLWKRNCNLEQHIDIIMYLLLLGIQKTIMKRIKTWHLKKGCGTSFTRYIDGILESIQDLKLSWYKAVPYKNGKLGGWVSESYIPMARLNK